MTAPDGPAQNRLLAAMLQTMSLSTCNALEPALLRAGDMLYEPGDHSPYAYFPTTAIASLQYVTQTGACCELAGVGNEGMVGVSLFLGGQSTSSSAVVQSTGGAYRLHRHALKQAFDQSVAVKRVLLRYAQSLAIQVTQTAACNRFHSISQCLCRWLLLTLDRTPSGDLVLTQELIASLLGVRREGITEAAGQLQLDGLIRYRRGHISVVDRPGLEAQACECYAVVSGELAHMLTDLRH